MIRLLAFSLVVSALLSSIANAEGRRLALLIGINAYPNFDTTRQLSTAVNDAAAVAAAIEDFGFETTVLPDLDRASFISAVSSFAGNVRPDDEVLFFYAGHGVNFGGANLMLPSDIPQPRSATPAEELRLQELAIREKFIVQTIAGAGARVTIIIIDACRNNPLNIDGDRSRSAISLKGLSVVPDKIDGVFTIYSASTGQTALDRLPGEVASSTLTSVFTRTLVRQIKVKGQSLSQIARATRLGVETLVQSATGTHQRPSAYDELNGDYYFSEPDVVAVNADGALQEWEAVKQADDEAVTRAFLVKYVDDPVYRALAESWLRKTTEEIESLAVARAETDYGALCDKLAAADGNTDNPDLVIPVYYRQLDGKTAIQACQRALGSDPENKRYRLQYARAANKLKLFDPAIENISKLIEAGYPAAYRELGDYYQYGDGYEQNYALAINTYETGVAKGGAGSAGALAGLYREGKGVRVDYSKAIHYAELGYGRGDPRSAFLLGAMLREGQGVKKNFSRARLVLSEAIERGSIQGHFSLAALQDEGKGGPRDPVAAGANLFRALQLRGFDDIVPKIINFATGPDAWSKDAVKELQSRLAEAGFYYGKIDGIIGPATKTAVRSYHEQR